MDRHKLSPITILLENGEPVEIKSVYDLPEMTQKLLEMNASIIEQRISRDASQETELSTISYDFSYPITLLYVFFLKKCSLSKVISEEVMNALFEISPEIQRIGFLGNIESGWVVKEGKEAVYSEKLKIVKNVKDILSSFSSNTQNALKSLYVDFQDALMDDQKDLGRTSRHYYNNSSSMLYIILHLSDENESYYRTFYEEPLTSLIERIK